MRKISYSGYRFPAEIIHQAVWLYLRFTLSFRDVEDLLAERGIVVSYETVRRWVNHFGPLIARGLICEPEVLLMDEPFSAVDAMTRAILQELILKIWEALPITVLFVTHDVDEAVFLSDRIISLSRAPASLREDVLIDLPYPRDQIVTRAAPEFHAFRQTLFSSIFQQEKEGLAHG